MVASWVVAGSSALCACSSESLPIAAGDVTDDDANHGAELLGQGRQALATGGRGNGPVERVDFDGCTEMAGIGLVAAGNARPLVPARYELAGDEENAVVVVRVVDCKAVSIDGGPSHSATVSQVGISLVDDDGGPGPDATADINNYTLWYATNEPSLARSLRGAGVDARYDRQLRYRLRATEAPVPSSPADAVLSIVARRPRGAAFSARGRVVLPESEPVSFVASWWTTSHGAPTLMRTVLPEIAFGASEMVVYPDADSDLAALVGSAELRFAVLDSVNMFAAASMTISRPE